MQSLSFFLTSGCASMAFAKSSTSCFFSSAGSKVRICFAPVDRHLETCLCACRQATSSCATVNASTTSRRSCVASAAAASSLRNSFACVQGNRLIFRYNRYFAMHVAICMYRCKFDECIFVPARMCGECIDTCFAGVVNVSRY